MTPFAIAGVQMHVAATHENVSAMTHKVDLAMARFPWVQMLLFSELAPYGPLPSNHPADLDAVLWSFQEKAREHNIWIIPGSLFVHDGERLYNESVVINPHGEIVGRYRKMFPFAPYEHGVTGGDQFLVFDVPDVGRFGLSICYDIWFPETTRQLASMGAEVLLHPVLTGTIDRDIELSIARSTAAMFQCYVFDINGLGAGGTGRSCVVGPSGNVIYQAAGQEEIIPIEVDLDMVRRQRATGLRGLGQTLKSFRDRNSNFPVYTDHFDNRYLNSLGPLSMPAQGTRDGIGVPAPSSFFEAPGQENEYPPANELKTLTK
ncbi:carbon-nitrogen hydrolase family protein [Nisaea sediminum]|uniref:carbon-nitrogen hydrolase family protein n=1 Tax=Nisaea sediminum TaxID=2775867 RepID=UPI001865D0FF|nr:carbon-nitrogen hydrolase family protein [Nisaea sediminum]